MTEILTDNCLSPPPPQSRPLQFLAHENHKIAHKKAQKSFINFKPRISNVAITGANFAPPPKM